MELRHLKYFVAVAELGTYTRAAQRLRVAQPALSRQIRGLEDELGIALLDRGPHGARLTPAGEAFLTEARAVIERTAQAVQVARAFATGERGELRIGYAPSPTVELLPRILHAFQSEAPGMRVRLHDLTTEELVAGVRGGRLDAALMVRPGRGAATGLVFEELTRYPVCVAMPPGHRLAASARVPLGELAAEPLLVYTRADYPEYHEWLDALFATLGVRPRVAEEHDGAMSLIAATESGAGVALVLSCFGCLAGPRLHLRELDPPPPSFVVGVLYRRAALCPASKRFLGLLRQTRRGEAAAKTN